MFSIKVNGKEVKDDLMVALFKDSEMVLVTDGDTYDKEFKTDKHNVDVYINITDKSGKDDDKINTVEELVVELAKQGEKLAMELQKEKKKNEMLKKANMELAEICNMLKEKIES